MPTKRFLILAGFSLLNLVSCAQPGDRAKSASQVPQTTTDSMYQYREASAAGTGKYYMGREIAQVMGHLGADWLERPERVQEERTDLLVSALGLQPDNVVADIGAGTGYFSFPISQVIAKGKVLAVDIQPEMIALLNQQKQRRKVTNVQPVLGNIDDPKLPAGGVDLVLMVDAYHEFSHPREMMEKIVGSLKPGGRVALVEYRAEDPEVPIKPLHKMSLKQARKEMEAVGLVLLENKDSLPWQHLMLFGKSEKKSGH
jgi:ubiquinone/menaquinone biosynthesis C-methylase UbiE